MPFERYKTAFNLSTRTRDVKEVVNKLEYPLWYDFCFHQCIRFLLSIVAEYSIFHDYSVTVRVAISLGITSEPHLD